MTMSRSSSTTAGCVKAPYFADGLALRERVPQGHKVALADLAEGDEVIRYNVVIGYALKALPKGSWINEHVIRMPSPPGLEDLPIATVKPPEMPPLEGFTFEGYRNADGSVGSRNILAITTTVQCVADVVAARGHAHQGRTAAALSERRRCREPRAHLWLRRRDRRAGRDGADPHACATSA